MSNVRDVLRKSKILLKTAGIESPGLDAEILLAEALGVERLKLYMNPDYCLNENEIIRFNSMIEERIQRKPISLILGRVSFYGREFLVNESVLTPRPETEELIEWALSLPLPRRTVALDMGTGSGCIGITLRCERPEWELHLNDISPGALNLAKENANRLCRLKNDESCIFFFHTGSMLEFEYETQFDLILSNPPYVYPDEYEHLMPEVKKYEPEIALVHENPPLFYSQILNHAKKLLKSGGFIGLELSPRLAPAALASAEKIFAEARILKDFSGLDRFLVCKNG